MLIQDIIPVKKEIKQNPPMQKLRKMNKKARNKLLPVLLIAFLIIETLSGIITPIQISINPLKITASQTKAAGEEWCNASWLYRKQITIDHAKVPNTDQTNFPALISHTDASLSHTTSGGKVTDLEGDDIIFTSSDGSTKLDYEIEKYDNATGEIIAWVRIPTLSSSVNTILYIYYGNSSITTSQENVNGVWDSNHKMVQHLQEAPVNDTAGHLDSTINTNNGTPKNFNGISTSTTNGTGQIDGVDVFDGVDDYIDAGTDASLNIGNEYTTEMWIKRNEAAGDYTLLRRISGSDRYWTYISNGGGDFKYNYMGTGADVTLTWPYSFGIVWHHVVLVKNDFIVTLFVDGESQGSQTAPNNFIHDVGLAIQYIGADWQLFFPLPPPGIPEGPIILFNGSIDEVRISNTARSADWIATSYNNQNSPSAFYALGAEEIPPASPTFPLQLKNDGSTVISNQGYTNETNVKLKASATDANDPETITLFFEAALNSGSFNSPAAPAVGTSCASGTAWSSCSNKIWYITSPSGDYTSTPYTGVTNITGLSDTTAYKWQVKSCDIGNACSSWVAYNTTTPNFTVDTTPPTAFNLSSPINNSLALSNKPTLSWSASSDSGSGLAKYQLYIDGSLDTDNISSSATSVTPTNFLSCGVRTWYIRIYDNANNYTDSSVFNLTMNCGSGLPPSASNQPITPEPTPENPEGGFSVIINNDDEHTNDQTVTLKLSAGKDTKRMAISNTEDFKYASQIPYQEEMGWELCNGREDICKNLALHVTGYTLQVYAKFYTQYGVSSEAVSDSIILKTIITETGTEETTNIETEEQTEDPNREGPASETEDNKGSESDENITAEDNNPSSFIFTKALKLGSFGTEVTQLQNKLKELSFFPKEIESNSNFGLTTENAVKEYQTSKEIYPCGIVGPRTRKALNNEEFITNKDHKFTKDLKYNDKNEEVKQLQTRLRDQNFFPYNIQSTSWFGPVTQKAVNIFQKFYNLIQSGVVDEGMRGVLNR